MSFFYFLAAFLFLRRLKISIKDSPVEAAWSNLINIAIVLVVVLFLLLQNSPISPVNGLVGCFVLGGLLYYADQQAAFKPFKPFISSHVPLVMVGFFTNIIRVIAPEFYERWDNFFQLLVVGAFVWIFARWANTKKQ